MAIEGKKINELDSLTTVTNETVLPAVYVQGQTTSETAQKVSISQISNKVQNDLSSTLSLKQDKLTAGENITISNDNVISATGGGGNIPTNITNIQESSGNISLESNKIYKVNLTGNTTFTLPTTIDNTILNQIYIQLNVAGNITVDLGTTHFFAGEFTIPFGLSWITYEYNSIEQVWYVGTVGGISPNTITDFCSPELAIQELTIGSAGTQYTMPYNGIVHFYSLFSPNYWGGIFIQVYKNGSMLYEIAAENNGNANTIWYPLSKGTTFALSYGGATNNMKAWLVKLNGASGN